MNRTAMAALAAALIALPQAGHAEGNFAQPPAERIELDIAGEAPSMSQTEVQIETGKYYRLILRSDGGGEVQFRSPGLWRNSWINLLVIGGVEVHAPGPMEALEFEEEPAEAAVAFVVLRPGEYPFQLIGATTVEGKFVVR